MAQATTGLGGDVNILEAMEMFKSVPDQVLPKYAQDPKLAIFAAAEMARREDMRKRYAQKAQKPTQPVIAQLAQSIAPSMPQMPPGMNNPQEAQPMQAPAPESGLGSIMPEQRMAQGGPVAFYPGGGVGMEFGGDPVVEEEKEVRVPAIINGKRVMATASELRAAGYPESTIQQRVKEASPKPVQPQTAAQPTQPAPQKAAAPLAIPPQPQAGGAPMGLQSIIKLGKDAMAQTGMQPIQVPEAYETAGRAEQLYKERQGRFKDELSPLMDKLQEFYSKQPTQADIDKAANRQIALGLMSSKRRDLAGGLAEGLQAGEQTKKSMAAENRAMEQASLQAQLAHAKYQDAIRRGDYDAAERAAREERTYGLQVQQLRQQQAMIPYEMGMGLARLMTPKGGDGQKGALTQAQAANIREKALERAAPEIAKLDQEYEAKAKSIFGFGGWGTNWREGPKGKELEQKKAAIVNKYVSMLAPELGGVTTPGAADLQRYYQMGQ